ncbi:MAG: hypothetical protein QNJ58_07195 [Desulfobacterales bacterium]|nr:hypothetical protein [Desulfobacterales bacterium]
MTNENADWNSGMVEYWNNGIKSGVWSNFNLMAIPQILNRSQSIKPSIPVFQYSSPPWLDLGQSRVFLTWS